MPPGPSPVELQTDCPGCGLEAGRVETYDPLAAPCRFGLPARTECKLCGEAWVAGLSRPTAHALDRLEAHRCPACDAPLPDSAVDDHACRACGARASLSLVVPARPIREPGALEAALDEWARREGHVDRHALVSATFRAPDIDALRARLDAGLPLEVLADPFANFGTRSRDVGSRPQLERAEEPVASSPPPPSAPPRAIVFPLVSVVAADGEIHPLEKALVDRFLESEGLLPLSPDEFRVHHPSTVAHLIPEHRREAIVQLMCETAAIDGLPDESERKVIRAYAAAWRVPDEKVDFWMWGYENMNTSLVRQLWLKIRRFILSARWNEAARTDP